MQTAPRKKLPYAVANFEKIIEEGYYYVDKTAYIHELEHYEVPVFLRPRRFGKTLWCSTLECYYDIRRKDRFTELFGQLEIGRAPTGLQNRFMVLRLNFSVVQASFDLEVLECNFRSVCLSSIGSFLRYYKEYFPSDFQVSEHMPVADVIQRILDVHKASALPPIYLIIDEYDNFINQFVTGGREDLYGDLTRGDSFFRTFFKAIKAGCEARAIGKVFITGVLPITMDDLTSGFNIAEIVTLKKHLHGMLGFTQSEVELYLLSVMKDYGLDMNLLPEVRQLVKNYYNGYRFQVDATETLYNSTILTYFLKHFALEAEYPPDMIDPNVKTDVGWIERLGFGPGTALELAQNLLCEDGLSYDNKSLSDKFNMNRFFERNHYPASLFFLGMLSVRDYDRLVFPNQTVQSIFADYYNALAHLDVHDGYAESFAAFRKDQDLEALFACYHKVYLGKIPAQAFDKVNENFVRTSFFELCTRYLLQQFTFAIEVNYPSGRSDFELLGRPDSPYRHRKWLVEFKYLPKTATQEFKRIASAPADAVTQVKSYAASILQDFPQYTVQCAVCVVHGAEAYKWWNV